MALSIKIWGARGSLPSPQLPSQLDAQIEGLLNDFFDHGHKKKTDIPAYLKALPRHRLGGYGGNTPCVEVRTDSSQVIIDGGSGIRPLGYELMNGPCGKGTGEVHVV